METIVIEQRSESPTSNSFVLEKPAGFTYSPGQFINIELTVPECDNRCNKRNFSLSSSPIDDHLMITTRHGVNRFKQVLEKLTKGDKINITGPYGRFILNEDLNMPAVMLSGGIGITPLHSMIKYASHIDLIKPISLIYTNSTVDDIPFKTDLDYLNRLNDCLVVYYTTTNDPGWDGRRGRIDAEMIKELTPDWQKSEFYVSGPAEMVMSLKKILVNMNVTAEMIKSELFTGY